MHISMSIVQLNWPVKIHNCSSVYYQNRTEHSYHEMNIWKKLWYYFKEAIGQSDRERNEWQCTYDHLSFRKQIQHLWVLPGFYYGIIPNPENILQTSFGCNKNTSQHLYKASNIVLLLKFSFLNLKWPLLCQIFEYSHETIFILCRKDYSF